VRPAALGALALLACGARPAVPAASAAPAVVDLHVDLGDAVHRRGMALDAPLLDANAERLARGHVARIVVPLFVADAGAMAPLAVRTEYAAIEQELRRALAASAWRGGVVLAFEGADGFADAPAELASFAARGACLVGLVHRRSNALGGASQEPAAAERRRGLSAEGRAVARAALAAGMLLDVAHASDATFDDLAALSEEAGRPLVDSHTGVRALVAIERNLDDARIARVARTGGVVAIDLHGGHVASVPGERSTLDDVAAHVEHAVAVAGIDHVALGSDLAAGIEAPSDDGAAIFPRLAERLRARGMTPAGITAVFSGNATRVLAECPRGE
jgi:membrane dipeptidase